MKVINQTRNATLSENLIIPKTLLDQSLGLLKYKTPIAMRLKTRYGIHTFGMQYAIDILILDKENKVAAIKENLKPNKIFTWNPQHHQVLELPTGTIKKSKTQISDIIILE